MKDAQELKKRFTALLIAPASLESAADRDDILTEWKRWEESHPAEGDEPDFPDVSSMRRETTI